MVTQAHVYYSDCSRDLTWHHAEQTNGVVSLVCSNFAFCGGRKVIAETLSLVMAAAAVTNIL
jgi:hypothetical protein